MTIMISPPWYDWRWVKQKNFPNSGCRPFHKVLVHSFWRKFRRASFLNLEHKTGHNSSSRTFQKVIPHSFWRKFRRTSFLPRPLDHFESNFLAVGLPKMLKSLKMVDTPPPISSPRPSQKFLWRPMVLRSSREHVFNASRVWKTWKLRNRIHLSKVTFLMEKISSQNEASTWS